MNKALHISMKVRNIGFMLDKLELKMRTFMLKRWKVGTKKCVSNLNMRKKGLIAGIFDNKAGKFNDKVRKNSQKSFITGLMFWNISLMFQNIKLKLRIKKKL